MSVLSVSYATHAFNSRTQGNIAYVYLLHMLRNVGKSALLTSLGHPNSYQWRML